MLKNTINVSSWLLLNALVPTSLPDIVSKQYKDQFVSWPSISPQAQTNYLFASLKALRFAWKDWKVLKSILCSGTASSRYSSFISLVTTFSRWSSFAWQSDSNAWDWWLKADAKRSRFWARVKIGKWIGPATNPKPRCRTCTKLRLFFGKIF